MFTNKSVEEIVDMICDPSKLEQVMSVPDILPVDMTNLTGMICGDNVKEVATILKTSIDLGILGSSVSICTKYSI